MTDILEVATETPGTPNCPICGHKTGAASGVWTDETPEPGDISMCIYCGGVIVFEEGLGSHPVTRQEEEGFSDGLRAQLDAAQAAYRRLDRPEDEE